jgi:hypothetical protein
MVSEACAQLLLGRGWPNAGLGLGAPSAVYHQGWRLHASLSVVPSRHRGRCRLTPHIPEYAQVFHDASVHILPVPARLSVV